jgi:hypothetical protein
LEQPGTNILLVLQSGTEFWVNVVVPQTGKAVEGVCPKVVQGWAITLPVHKRNNKITIGKLTLLNRLIGICNS